MIYGVVNETDTNISLSDGHELIFSSIESLAKFGFEPLEGESRTNLEKLFSEGKKARFIVHYSCACAEDNNIKIAHIERIKSRG